MNTKEALDFWNRAKKALGAAQTIVHEDPDSSASRAYYAAFHAVSAYFALEGKTFSKHSVLESAVHKDLVKPGIWPVAIGKNFSWLVSTRSTGDYGGGMHVAEQDAIIAIDKARQILECVNMQKPAIFTL
jgi:uncharacterized protein (UPF0332 family)